MKTVNPRDAYDRRRFVDAMKDLSDLGVISHNLNTPEGNWDPKFRKDLEILLDDPNIPEDEQISYAGMAPDSVIKDANKAHSQYDKQMQNYAITNFSTLLGKLSGETLLQLVASVLPVAETGKKNLDRVVKAIQEKRKIAKISKEGGIEQYVAEKLANASEWRKQAYFGYSIGNPDYIQRTFKAYAQSTEADLIKEIFEEDRKTIKSEKLRRILKENYAQLIAKDTEDSDKVAEAYLSAIAQGAYQAVKPEEKDKPGSIARTGKVAP